MALAKLGGAKLTCCVVDLVPSGFYYVPLQRDRLVIEMIQERLQKLMFIGILVFKL